MSLNITEVKSELKDLFERKKRIKTWKLLDKVYKSMNEESRIEDYGDFLREISEYNEEFYNGNVYTMLHVGIPEMTEIDEYLLKNYGLANGEEIVEIFEGNISDKNFSTSGKIFLTNYRMMISGSRSSTSKSTFGGPRSLLELRKELKHLKKGSRIEKSLSGEASSRNLMHVGYYYPIFGAYKLKRKKSSINYRADIEYQKGSKTKKEKLNIRISPYKLKGEQKEDYRKRTTELLDKIEKILLEYQA